MLASLVNQKRQLCNDGVDNKRHSTLMLWQVPQNGNDKQIRAGAPSNRLCPKIVVDRLELYKVTMQITTVQENLRIFLHSVSV